MAGIVSSADGSKWLLYHGNYAGHRFSPLTQITPQNVSQLKAQWTFQTRLTPNFQTTPLMIDNVLYVSTPYNQAPSTSLVGATACRKYNAWALLWKNSRRPPPLRRSR